MAKTWVIAALGFAVSASITRVLRQGLSKRREERTSREDVQRWEGEGGQVPGATLGSAAAKPNAGQAKSYSATS